MKGEDSIRYARRRIARLEKDRQPQAIIDRLNAALEHTEAFATTHPNLDFALLIPTDTALHKSILDAVGPVRRLLAETGVYDYADHPKGSEKTYLDGYLFSYGQEWRAPVSLYRPTTKDGDPRIWMSGIKGRVDPFDLLMVTTDGYTVYLTDMNSLPDSASEFERVAAACASEDHYSAVEAKLLDELRELSAQGFVPSVRKGDTGVGMTLEHALGIEPNSDRGPDIWGIELKGRRLTRTATHRTLFSEKPDWGLSEYSALGFLDEFKYWDSDKERWALYSTVYGSHVNPQHFQLAVDRDADTLSCAYDGPNGPHPAALVWSTEALRKHFRTKHRHTFWVGAEVHRHSGGPEEFHYTDVTITSGPDYMAIPDLVVAGQLTVDLTLTYKEGAKKPRARDHGYLWRATPAGWARLFLTGRKVDLTA